MTVPSPLRILLLATACVLGSVLDPVGAQFQPHCDGRQVIVHLFEWKWTDVAAECERYLAGAGYCGVQVRRGGSNLLSRDSDCSCDIYTNALIALEF